MHTLIIANGEAPGKELAQQEAAKAELIICADGGANSARSLGVQPDYVVGDLDSITEESKAKIPAEKLIHKPSQYATDLEKALDLALEKGATSIALLGATKDRLDHQITNLNIVQKYADKVPITIIDDTGFGLFVNDSWEHESEIGQQISLTAFQKTEGITTQGLKYPLENTTMEWGINNGQSNEVIKNPVKISLKKGSLFVFCVTPN